MAKEPLFPNLPDKKTCPVCHKEFSRIRNGKKIDSRSWFIKTYCSRKCLIENRRRSGDNLFK